MWPETHLCDRFTSGATSYPAPHTPWNTTRTIVGDHSDGMGKVVVHLCRSSLEMGLDITCVSWGLGVLPEQICGRKHTYAIDSPPVPLHTQRHIRHRTQRAPSSGITPMAWGKSLHIFADLGTKWCSTSPTPHGGWACCLSKYVGGNTLLQRR